MYTVAGDLFSALRLRANWSRKSCFSTGVKGRLPTAVVAVLFCVMLLGGKWLANPSLPGVFPVVAVAAIIGPVAMMVWLMTKSFWFQAWLASCAGIALITLTLIIGMFPALVPSSLDPAFSMTIENAASSPLTLKIMLTVALIMVPAVIFYQGWVYLLFWRDLDENDSAEVPSSP